MTFNERARRGCSHPPRLRSLTVVGALLRGGGVCRFAYRSASDLNSSDVTYERGYFGAFYPQGGYTLDLVPNLAPQWYALRPSALRLARAASSVVALLRMARSPATSSLFPGTCAERM